MTSQSFNTGATSAPVHLFRVGSDSSVSSMNTDHTVVPAKGTQEAFDNPATLSDWQENTWSHPTSQASNSSNLPPPYSKTFSKNQTDTKISHVHAPTQSAAPQAESSESLPDPENRNHNLIKSELSTYTHKNLLNYSVQKTKTYDVAVHKISRLQQHIKNLEKLERGPARRTRRWLLLVTILLAALMIVAWTLAGLFKIERDGLRREVKALKIMSGPTPEVKRPVSNLIPASTVAGSGTSTFVTLTVSTERTSTEVVSVSVTATPTPTPTRSKGPDVGQGQGLPHGCIDRGGGVVDCVGALDDKDF